MSWKNGVNVFTVDFFAPLFLHVHCRSPNTEKRGNITFCSVSVEIITFDQHVVLIYLQGLSLGERYQYLVGLSQRKSIIRINAAIFKDYVRATPRNYSMIIMFNAMAPQRQCVICRYASEEFQIVANSFRYSQAYSNKLFFGVVDFDEGTDVFNIVSVICIAGATLHLIYLNNVVN